MAFRSWVLVAFALVWGGLAGAEPDSPTEYQVKAALLFNFAKFVDWPASAFAGPEAPFVIGMVGEDPFGPALEETLRNKNVNGRAIRIEHLGPGQDLKSCHLLFVCASERKRLAALLGSLEKAPVLTVGDGLERFLGGGGMVNLLQQNNKVRFAVSQERVAQSGLKMSSKLLRLAVATREEK
jgi:hypothetical protein